MVKEACWKGWNFSLRGLKLTKLDEVLLGCSHPLGRPFQVAAKMARPVVFEHAKMARPVVFEHAKHPCLW